MFGTVLKNNFILTIKEISDDPDQLKIWEKCPRKAYAYIPISMASVTVGIITIDDIPFLKLNISTIRILSLIAELAVPALKNIITYQDLQDMIKTDPVTEMLKYDSFLNMADVEFKKSIRYNLKFSVIILEIEGLLEIEETFGHDIRIEAIKWISNKTKEILRNVDIAGVGPRESQFSIALPVTDTEGALAAIDRLKFLEKPANEIPKWHQNLLFFYGASSYHPSMETLDSMLKMAENSIELNKSSKMKTQSLT
jgi:diguanylate cyclase (GGDEF)-like protein